MSEEVIFKRGATGEIVGASIRDTSGPTSPPGAWRTVSNVMRSLFDRNALNSERLATIENRLAKLDGGLSSEKAKFAAFKSVNVDRRLAGKDELCFEMRKPK
jgi:hypothetical protein